MKYILLFIVTLFSGFPLLAYSSEEVRLSSGKQLFLNTSHSDLLEYMHKSDKTDGALIILKTNKNKDNLTTAGFIVQEYISKQAYIVYLPSLANVPDSASLQDAGITAWASFSPEDKINNYLIEEQIVQQNVEVAILVSVVKPFDSLSFLSVLSDLNASLSNVQKWNHSNSVISILEVMIEGSKIPLLASSSLVKYVNPVFTDNAMLDHTIGFTGSRRAVVPLAAGGQGLDGEGVVVGVGDDTDPLHVDISDRLISFNARYNSSHGMHVTGTVGGAGIRDQRYTGFAPRSTMISNYFSLIISDAESYFNDFGMNITNNSYGTQLGNCDYFGVYDLYSQFLDEQQYRIPEILHIYASGNDGYKHCPPYPSSYATVAGAYQTAKNVLTVGRTGKSKSLVVYNSSSSGPVRDGRVKPEITAMGLRLIAPGFDDNYVSNGGTSMACPNVAGAAVLLTQKYKKIYNNNLPPGALLKALLVNGARELDNPGPTFLHGFGFMNLTNSLRMLDNQTFFSDTINNGVQQNYVITVPNGTAKLKVMLYWNDPAATPLSQSTLINDLNLSVQTPNNETILPYILDPSPMGVQSAAIRGIDSINNIEQVTILQPDAGNYILKVQGHHVPEANQIYYLVYDFVPQSLSLQYPIGAEKLIAGDSTYVYWEKPENTSGFTLEYSIDNGNNWHVISNTIAGDERDFVWYLPSNVNSTQCKMRITAHGTNEQEESNPFIISNRVIARLAPDSLQCPGNTLMSWNPIDGIDTYRVYKKTGAEMTAVADVTTNNYLFRNLHFDTIYWTAVAPIINGIEGIRSIAIKRQPFSGNCIDFNSHGDLSISTLTNIKGGREKTSSQLQMEPLIIRVHNNDILPANNYQIAYQINQQNWKTTSPNTVIPPSSSAIVHVADEDFSATGNYDLTFVVINQNFTDPVKANDTFRTSFKHVSNPVMNLYANDYIGDFESTNALNLIGDQVIGIGTDEAAAKWDFEPSNSIGRLRSFVNSSVTIEGNRSLSLDNLVNTKDSIHSSSLNLLTGTFNLSNYDINHDEIRVDFDYRVHGIPKFDTANHFWIRGNDTAQWISVMQYQYDTLNIGLALHSGTISLNDYLSSNNQQFSSSTQVRFGQYDTSQIASYHYGNGLTIDNIKIYPVRNDISLLGINQLYRHHCELDNPMPIQIALKNNVQNTIYQIAVSYRIDSSNHIVTEIIDSISAKETLIYTFQTLADFSTIKEYQLDVWTHLSSDTYRLNDSLLDYKIRHQATISEYPYLEDFEAGESNFYTDGRLSSWQLITPQIGRIKYAASGKKAWKTDADGGYNNFEHSYLYSPCFDISSLVMPYLSFSMAWVFQQPTNAEENDSFQIKDVGYVEYSTGNGIWKKLIAGENGINWYNDDTAQVWTNATKTYWHVATCPIPKNEGNIISFRFVIETDVNTRYEGIAIDDIHVYDLKYPIYDSADLSKPLSHIVEIEDSVNFVENGYILANLKNGHGTLGKTDLQTFAHKNYINYDSSQYLIPRHFVLQSESPVANGEEIDLSFFLTDEKLETLRLDTICYSCVPTLEAYRLGITQYSDADKSKENHTLEDNHNGNYTFIPHHQIRWIPYANGYIAKTKVNKLSEFWFNVGGATGNQHLAADYFSFDAQRRGSRDVVLTWKSSIDTAIETYYLQRADSSMNFNTIAVYESLEQLNQVSYQHLDIPSFNYPVLYYRVLYTMKEGATYSSLIKELNWFDFEGAVRIYPNPVHNELHLEWLKGNKEPLKWQIFNIEGREVKSGDIQDALYSGKLTIHLNDYVSKGVYLLKVIGANKTWDLKFVKR